MFGRGGGMLLYDAKLIVVFGPLFFEHREMCGYVPTTFFFDKYIRVDTIGESHL